MAGEDIIDALLRNNGGRISFPVRAEDGDITFGGDQFTFVTKQIGGEDDGDSVE